MPTRAHLQGRRVHPGRLQVQLRELRLPVGPQVLITEAARDLQSCAVAVIMMLQQLPGVCACVRLCVHAHL